MSFFIPCLVSIFGRDRNECAIFIFSKTNDGIKIINAVHMKVNGVIKLLRSLYDLWAAMAVT